MTPSQAKRVAAARKALAELAAGYFYDGLGNKFQLTPLLKARREALIDAELEEALMDSTPPEHYKDVKSEPARVEPKNPAAAAPALSEEEIEWWRTMLLDRLEDKRAANALCDMALRALEQQAARQVAWRWRFGPEHQWHYCEQEHQRSAQAYDWEPVYTAPKQKEGKP